MQHYAEVIDAANQCAVKVLCIRTPGSVNSHPWYSEHSHWYYEHSPFVLCVLTMGTAQVTEAANKYATTFAATFGEIAQAVLVRRLRSQRVQQVSCNNVQ